MKKIKKYPKVVIVGRTNVGKSTLFNRIAKKAKSIVLEEEGVTRDYITEIITWDKKTFELIDTGGVSFKKEKDPILEEVRLNVLNLLDKASVILFLCDGKNGLVTDDRHIAKILHKTKKPTFLLVNKADNINALRENLYEFYALGFKDLIEVSALHGKGVTDLLDVTTKLLEKPEEIIVEDKETYKITLIGKPNVGKSSLTNLLLNGERSIVSSVAGTTREAISDFTYFSQDLVLITDTAGIRRKKNVKEDIENLMVKSSLSAIRTSDIVLLIADASELKLSDQELKLLFYAYEEKKAIVLAFNKTDLISEGEREYLEHMISEYNFILKKIPIVWISCKDKKNVTKVDKQIKKVWERLKYKFDDEEINELVKTALQEKPLFHKKQEIRLHRIRTVENSRVPTFMLRVNKPEWFGDSQQGFVENLLRKKYDLLGCPVKFIVKKKY